MKIEKYSVCCHVLFILLNTIHEMCYIEVHMLLAGNRFSVSSLLMNRLRIFMHLWHMKVHKIHVNTVLYVRNQYIAFTTRKIQGNMENNVIFSIGLKEKILYENKYLQAFI